MWGLQMSTDIRLNNKQCIEPGMQLWSRVSYMYKKRTVGGVIDIQTAITKDCQ